MSLLKRIAYGILFGLIIASLFGLSIFYYIIIYNWYIPPISHQIPVYFDYIQPLPTASIELSSNVFWKGQAYSIVLELNLPESPSNLEMGNFMTSLALHDKTLHKVNRPAIMKYRSPLVQLCRIAMNILPLLFDFMKESQKLEIYLLEHFVEQGGASKMQLVLSNPKIQIYDARVRIEAEYGGLRYLMYYWFVPTAALCVLVFFFTQLAFALFMYLAFTSSSTLSSREINGHAEDLFTDKTLPNGGSKKTIEMYDESDMDDQECPSE